MTIRATLLVLAVALLAAVTGSVHAQVADHLKCYQIKDPLKLKGPKPPWLDLTGPHFGSESCKIVGSTRLFCVPVTKTVTADIQRKFGRDGFADFVPTPLPGAETITQDKLCYKITCEGRFPAEQRVADQFGTRNVEKLKPFLLCGPAATTSTGSVSFSWTVGGQSAAVGCPAGSQVRIESTAGPAPVDQSVDCTLGTGQVDDLPPGAYTFRATLVDNVSNPVVDNLQVSVLAGMVAAVSPIDFVPSGAAGSVSFSWTVGGQSAAVDKNH